MWTQRDGELEGRRGPSAVWRTSRGTAVRRGAGGGWAEAERPLNLLASL